MIPFQFLTLLVVLDNTTCSVEQYTGCVVIPSYFFLAQTNFLNTMILLVFHGWYGIHFGYCGVIKLLWYE